MLIELLNQMAENGDSSSSDSSTSGPAGFFGGGSGDTLRRSVKTEFETFGLFRVAAGGTHR